MKPQTFYLALASSLFLSACGGGGGSAGSTGPGPVQTSTLSTITASNSKQVAANGYTANTMLGDSSSSVTDVLTGVSIGGAGISAPSPVIKLVKRAFGQGGAPLLTGVTMSQACTGGGTITIDANLRNTQTISNGDTMTVNAQNCVEDGNRMNGGLSISFSNVSGDLINTSSGAATMDTRFNNFSMAGNNETATINGDMKIALTVTNSTSSSATISGNSLQISAQTGSAAPVSLTLSAYSVSGSTNGVTTSSAANFTLSGNASGLGQFAYTVKNLQPFVSVGTAMPGSGSLIVNGAASSVTVTALNASSVRLDYSAKGDGAITQTATLSWAEFIASI